MKKYIIFICILFLFNSKSFSQDLKKNHITDAFENEIKIFFNRQNNNFIKAHNLSADIADDFIHLKYKNIPYDSVFLEINNIYFINNYVVYKTDLKILKDTVITDTLINLKIKSKIINNILINDTVKDTIILTQDTVKKILYRNDHMFLYYNQKTSEIKKVKTALYEPKNLLSSFYIGPGVEYITPIKGKQFNKFLKRSNFITYNLIASATLKLNNFIYIYKDKDIYGNLRYNYASDIFEFNFGYILGYRDSSSLTFYSNKYYSDFVKIKEIISNHFYGALVLCPSMYYIKITRFNKLYFYAMIGPSYNILNIKGKDSYKKDLTFMYQNLSYHWGLGLKLNISGWSGADNDFYIYMGINGWRYNNEMLESNLRAYFFNFGVSFYFL